MNTYSCDLPKSAFLLLILFNWTSDVNGIKCFVCNSMRDAECTDLRGYHLRSGNDSSETNLLSQLTEEKENVNLALSYLKECEDGVGGKESFCRKTDQYIHVRRMRVVVRSCGWSKHDRGCYWSDNNARTEHVCQCFDDGCNSAPGGAQIMFLFAVTAFGVLFVVR
ncbi:uncharacterized protein LOC135941112 [Cloeon dipterum]|uniref:uncharacterized protein LOC135941112 n=1 Tax=Cloeon dipterum TaxID=197152 RepID=UPI003220680A